MPRLSIMLGQQGEQRLIPITLGERKMALNIWGAQYPRERVAEVPVPKATDSYKPVLHIDFVDMVEDTLGNHGYYFGEQAHVLNKSGNQYFGMAELYNDTAYQEYRLVGGWRNSYDKSLAAKFVVGSCVFVCSNLAFSGEIMIGRKHTANVLRDLPTLLNEAAKQVTPLRDLQDRRFERYKKAPLNDYIVNSAIVDIIRKNIIPPSKVGLLIQECYEPRHEEHLTDGHRTGWTVFNAATETLKLTSAMTLPQRTQELHKLVDHYTGFEVVA